MMRKKILPERWMITDVKKTDPLLAAQNLPRNSGIILRDYDLSFSKRFELGKTLRKICAKRRIIFLVALDAKLAIKLKADGIHLPEFAAPEIHKWRAKKPGWIITASAHSRKSIYAANIAGADAIFLSPVFKTSSHPEKKPIGTIRFSRYIYNVNPHIPVYGLGGIKDGHAKALKMAGFKGFAGISWVKN